jgi:hypothetical protein
MLYSHQVLPDNIQIILALIGEELKSYKFFNSLREIGLDDSFYQSNLSSLILSKAGFYEESDEVSDYYFNLLSRYSQQLEPKDASVKQQALEVYLDLLAFKRRCYLS